MSKQNNSYNQDPRLLYKHFSGSSVNQEMLGGQQRDLEVGNLRDCMVPRILMIR